MSEVATVAVDERLFNEIKAQSARVISSKSRWTTAHEEAKDRKKEYEGALETLQTLVGRMASGDVDALPLFDSMNDKIDAAKADPVVSKLCDRLITHGHDVNILIVAGYTEEERNLALQYCDAKDSAKELTDAGAEDVPAVEVPAFLIPQPLTPIEIADLLVRVEKAGHPLTEQVIQEMSAARRAEMVEWLVHVETVTAERGEALTANDLRLSPCWLENLSDEIQEQEPTEDDEEATEVEAAAEVEDEPQPENLPPPAKSRRRRNGSDEARA